MQTIFERLWLCSHESFWPCSKSDFLFKLSPMTSIYVSITKNVNHIKHAQKNTNVTVQCFTVSSRVIDFNRCCFILYKILMKRHIDFETFMISNNFYLVIFKLFYLSLVNIKKLRYTKQIRCVFTNKDAGKCKYTHIN